MGNKMETIKMEDSVIYQDGNYIFNIALCNKLSHLAEASTYSSICGGFYEGCQQWATHNIDTWVEVENKKYFGWEIYFNDKEETAKVYIEKSKLAYLSKLKNFKHIVNTLKKNLQIK